MYICICVYICICICIYICIYISFIYIYLLYISKLDPLLPDAHVVVCVCVCVVVCIRIYNRTRTYAHALLHTHTHTHIHTHPHTGIPESVEKAGIPDPQVCMSVCLSVFLYVCTYVCVCVCVCMYVFMYKSCCFQKWKYMQVFRVLKNAATCKPDSQAFILIHSLVIFSENSSWYWRCVVKVLEHWDFRTSGSPLRTSTDARRP